jgi:hypothetical protein
MRGNVASSALSPTGLTFAAQPHVSARLVSVGFAKRFVSVIGSRSIPSGPCKQLQRLSPSLSISLSALLFYSLSINKQNYTAQAVSKRRERPGMRSGVWTILLFALFAAHRGLARGLDNRFDLYAIYNF